MTPRIITNSRLPKLLSWFIPIKAITLGPWIFIAGKSNAKLIRHELIHVVQYKELWYLGFVMLYLYDWLEGLVRFRSLGKAYRAIRFEQEARTWQEYPGYLEARVPHAWRTHRVKGYKGD